jgi:hypothetical protein
MEKTWQPSFKIDPALVAHSDDAVWAEARLLSSNGHSDENVSCMRTFFPTSVAAKYSRAHTVFPLHFGDLSFYYFLAYVDFHLPLGEQRSRFANPNRTATHFTVEPFIEDGRSREYAPPKTFSSMRQFDHGPATGIPQYLAIISRNFSAFCRSTADVVTT